MQSSPAVFLRAAVMFGVLIVLPAYALLGTSLPDKLLPMFQHLVKQNERPPGGDPQSNPPAPSGSGPYASAAPDWPASTGVERSAETSDGRFPNRPVSWEEAAPENAPGQFSLFNRTAVRVSDEGRRVIPPDDIISRRVQALSEVGATRITVSVEYADRTPSYWCTCQVADRRERFEAVAANMLGAMDKVLDKIHAWRSAAAPPRR
jgi:hypothetical protein